MSEVKKSVVSALAVMSAAGMVVFGFSLRGRNDLGGAGDPTMVAGGFKNLIVSTQKQVDVPASDYFYELSDKLKREYVEPVQDEQKFAVGAVRGMVGSLGDPKSVFMGKEEFQAYLRARQGRFEGIGADFALSMPPGSQKAKVQTTGEETAEEAVFEGPQIPRLVVTALVPGGPADKAGVKGGDFVYSVDTHWLVNSADVVAFRKAQDKFLKKQLPIAELNKLRNDLRKKMERALMPMKAKDKLTVGASGAVNVVWERAGQKRTTLIQKAPSQMPAFRQNESSILLPFTSDSVELLKKSVQGATQLTIDLRNNTLGDFEVMRQCLAVLAPTGKYGTLSTQRKEQAQPLAVQKGNPKPPKLTLIVDKSTRGAAEIFALALSSKGVARLSGSQMGGDRSVLQITQLPDGSGYTLVTAEYRTSTDGVVAHGGTE